MAEYRINHKLLDQVLDAIAACPQRWDQDDWFRPRPRSKCGTAMCFAGRAAHLEGHEPPDDVDLGWRIEGMHVEYWAQKTLGLSDSETIDLFASFNDRRDLKRIVRELHAKEGYVKEKVDA